MTENHDLDEADFGDELGDALGDELGDDLVDELGDDLGEDFDGEDFDDGEFEDDDSIDEAVDDADDDDELDDDDDEDDDDVPAPADDDDDDDVHPSDVEADLEEILRDRIAASDDDEDDEAETTGDPKLATVVAPPRADEWTCNQCFLIVSASQFGSRSSPICPSGEEPCESIERIRSG